MMNMYFTTVLQMKDILFHGLDTHNTKEMMLFSVVIFLATILFSALTAAKEIIAAKRKMNPLTRSQQDFNDFANSMDSGGSHSELLSSLRIPTNVSVVRKHKFCLFVVEAAIHMIKFAYGYLLMLLVMTYSVWFTLAVVLGSGIGYLIFQPISAHIASIYSQPPKSMHTCHGEDDATNYMRNDATAVSQSNSVFLCAVTTRDSIPSTQDDDLSVHHI